MLNGFGRTPQGVRGLKLLGVGQPTPHTTSHPARGAWIEIINGEALASATASRTPQGVRGLKSKGGGICLKWCLSHPARGAWIEITGRRRINDVRTSHPARGAWIEILSKTVRCKCYTGRTPQGVRGLKSIVPLAMPHAFSSRTPQGVRGLKLISVK